MTAITATIRTHRRSLAIIGAIVAIAIVVLGIVVFAMNPSHDLNHMVSTFHHMPRFVQALVGTHHLGA